MRTKNGVGRDSEGKFTSKQSRGKDSKMDNLKGGQGRKKQGGGTMK